MGDGDHEPWAQLVSLTDLDSPPLLISGDKFVIGRNEDCDMPHVGNKLVSGHHCYIERDGKKSVWLYDTSTNGTLLNLSTKLSKGECRELKHGDEIHVVHKKKNTDEDIGYMFQDLEALKAETSSDLEESTQEYTQPLELDQTLTDEEINNISTPNKEKSIKRKSDEESLAIPAKKICKKSSDENPSRSAKNDRNIKEQKGKEWQQGKKEKTTEEQKTTKSGVDDSIEKDKSGATFFSKAKQPSDEAEDAIAETLVCIICQELLHDCISLQPCMHSFCAGCYSEWMERSNECPSCRVKVERISKNHIVNNLVEAYLKLNPSKKRSEDELKELDAKNKITRDMLYPVKTPRGCESESENDYSDEEAEDDDEEETNHGLYHHQRGRPLCRQCPNYDPNTAQTVGIMGAARQALVAFQQFLRGRGEANQAGSTTGAGPSTEAEPEGASGDRSSISGDAPDPDAKVFPTPPQYTCTPNQYHVNCQCCFQMMPSRIAQHTIANPLPPMQCSICFLFFCHAYWGCHNPNCNGCIAKLKDLNFGKLCLFNLINDNLHESKIFKNYLEANNLSVRDVWKECVTRMEQGKYFYPNFPTLRIRDDPPVCYRCGLTIFKELAFQYRKDIPADQLPDSVTKRPNCYWGRNCRTQRNKPEHALRFNHICDQTRTA